MGLDRWSGSGRVAGPACHRRTGGPDADRRGPANLRLDGNRLPAGALCTCSLQSADLPRGWARAGRRMVGHAVARRAGDWPPCSSGRGSPRSSGCSGWRSVMWCQGLRPAVARRHSRLARRCDVVPLHVATGLAAGGRGGTMLVLAPAPAGDRRAAADRCRARLRLPRARSPLAPMAGHARVALRPGSEHAAVGGTVAAGVARAGAATPGGTLAAVAVALCRASVAAVAALRSFSARSRRARRSTKGFPRWRSCRRRRAAAEPADLRERQEMTNRLIASPDASIRRSKPCPANNSSPKRWLGMLEVARETSPTPALPTCFRRALRAPGRGAGRPADLHRSLAIQWSLPFTVAGPICARPLSFGLFGDR